MITTLPLLLKLIGLSCIAVLFVVAEPLILLKRRLGLKEEDYELWGEKKRFIFRLLDCVLCSGFWIGLIFTLNILQAATVAVVAEIIFKQLNKS